MPSSWRPAPIGSRMEPSNPAAMAEDDDQTRAATEPDEDLAEEELKGPERRCIVTGQVLPKADLIRFVVSPDGMVVADMAERLGGRGIWLCPRRDVVNTAITKRLFAKVARCRAEAPADLADRIETLLTGRCLATIGFARRAGAAVAGYEKVKAEILGGRLQVLVQARDSAADGAGRLRAMAAGLSEVRVLDRAELGSVFGRDDVVHVGLASGRLATALAQQARALAGFRDVTS